MIATTIPSYNFQMTSNSSWSLLQPSDHTLLARIFPCKSSGAECRLVLLKWQPYYYCWEITHVLPHTPKRSCILFFLCGKCEPSTLTTVLMPFMAVSWLFAISRDDSSSPSNERSRLITPPSASTVSQRLPDKWTLLANFLVLPQCFLFAKWNTSTKPAVYHMKNTSWGD